MINIINNYYNSLLFKTFKSYPSRWIFNKRPLDSLRNNTPRFSMQNVGHNTLKHVLFGKHSRGRSKHRTNHSGKVSLCSNVFNTGFDDKIIRQRSGHRDAVNTYKHPSIL